VGKASTENIARSFSVTRGDPQNYTILSPFCKFLRDGFLLPKKDRIPNPYIAKIWGNVSEIYRGPSIIESESVKCFVTKKFGVLNSE
jgi:hypothetical protein